MPKPCRQSQKKLSSTIRQFLVKLAFDVLDPKLTGKCSLLDDVQKELHFLIYECSTLEERNNERFAALQKIIRHPNKKPSEKLKTREADVKPESKEDYLAVDPEMNDFIVPDNFLEFEDNHRPSKKRSSCHDFVSKRKHKQKKIVCEDDIEDEIISKEVQPFLCDSAHTSLTASIVSEHDIHHSNVPSLSIKFALTNSPDVSLSSAHSSSSAESSSSSSHTTEIKTNALHDERNDIFEWFKNGRSHMVINASAGTGKTTVIKEGLKFVAQNVKTLYTTFGKHNQNAKAKVTMHKNITTHILSTLGYSMICQHWPKAKPDATIEYKRISQSIKTHPDKFGLLVKEFEHTLRMKKDAKQTNTENLVKKMLVRLISLAKNKFVQLDQKKLEQICADNAINFGTACSEACMLVLHACALARRGTPENDAISFEDMVWLTVAKSWALPMYDFICADASEDMNLPQYIMMKSLCKPSGRMLFVGDDRQATCGFLDDAKKNLKFIECDLKASVMSLPIVYRCPKVIAAFISTIEATDDDYVVAENACNGEIHCISSSSIHDYCTSGDVVIARTNADLMYLACELHQLGKEVCIMGSHFAKKLLKLVKKLNAETIGELMNNLNQENDLTLQKTHMLSQNVKKEEDYDALKSISALATSCQTIHELNQKIAHFFKIGMSKQACISLAIVHEVKGFEWDRTFVLANSFRDSQNLYYIAITRAKKELFVCMDKT